MTSPFCSPANNDNMTLVLSKTQYDPYQSSQKSIGFEERPQKSTSDFWSLGANTAEGGSNLQQLMENPKIYEQYNVVPNNDRRADSKDQFNQKQPRSSKQESESESENNFSSHQLGYENEMARFSHERGDDSEYSQNKKEQSGIPSDIPLRQSHPLNHALYNNFDLDIDSAEMSQNQIEERQSDDMQINIRPSSAFDKRNPNTKKVELSLKQKARTAANPLAAALELESDESPKPNESLSVQPQTKPKPQGDKLLLTITSYKPKSKGVKNDQKINLLKSYDGVRSPQGSENRIFPQTSDRAKTPSESSKSGQSGKISNLKNNASLKR